MEVDRPCLRHILDPDRQAHKTFAVQLTSGSSKIVNGRVIDRDEGGWSTWMHTEVTRKGSWIRRTEFYQTVGHREWLNKKIFL